MKIVSTQYSLPYRSLDIYVSGCYGDCHNCHNPEIKDFSVGTPYKEEVQKIIDKINQFSLLIKNIWILGGEPLDQDEEELIDLLKQLKAIDKNIDIWLFTRFEIDEISEKVKENCDYIKCGMFIENLWTHENIQYGVKLMTSNQNIYKLKEDEPCIR